MEPAAPLAPLTGLDSLKVAILSHRPCSTESTSATQQARRWIGQKPFLDPDMKKARQVLLACADLHTAGLLAFLGEVGGASPKAEELGAEPEAEDPSEAEEPAEAGGARKKKTNKKKQAGGKAEEPGGAQEAEESSEDEEPAGPEGKKKKTNKRKKAGGTKGWPTFNYRKCNLSQIEDGEAANAERSRLRLKRDLFTE